jgi:heme exporter protein D
MPDLGKYTLTVLSAYGVSITLILGVVWLSLYQSRKAKQALDRQQERTNRNG